MDKRQGIMGGTFDPIHYGHLLLGERAYEQFYLDQILYMPSGNPPHKQNRQGRASIRQRMDMVELAIRDNPHFSLLDAEMHTDGYSYTYMTLERLKAQNPHTEYYFIIGADSLFDFERWKYPERICSQAKILAAGRSEAGWTEVNRKIRELSERFQSEFYYLEAPHVDISSHSLRENIHDGKSVRYLLPDEVLSYIMEHDIYR